LLILYKARSAEKLVAHAQETVMSERRAGLRRTLSVCSYGYVVLMFSKHGHNAL